MSYYPPLPGKILKYSIPYEKVCWGVATLLQMFCCWAANTFGKRKPMASRIFNSFLKHVREGYFNNVKKATFLENFLKTQKGI
jgi:hypothetical protein